jgi:hypothetical protein
MTTDMLTETPCTLRFEKCKGGFCIECCCGNDGVCADLTSLCESLCGDDLTCCCTLDGKQVCCVEICCGDCDCNCDCQQDGNRCRIVCTSDDRKCCEMLQACCDCIEACCQAGGCCILSFGDTCVCCGRCG